MWSCLVFYFGIDEREEQLIRAFSFGKDLCQSLFSLVMQTAVFIVSLMQSTSALMVRICMNKRLCVRSYCWGHCVWTWAEEWKQVASSHLGGTCFFVFAVWCCLMLFDAVWRISLTGLGVLEERMMWSGLWFWCSMKGQSQAAGTWTLQQDSANSTWKELINLSWENYNSLQSGMRHAGGMGDHCQTSAMLLCLFGSLQEGGGTPGSPLSMSLAR